jgi:hypothetical protein
MFRQKEQSKAKGAMEEEEEEEEEDEDREDRFSVYVLGRNAMAAPRATIFTCSIVPSHLWPWDRGTERERAPPPPFLLPSSDSLFSAGIGFVSASSIDRLSSTMVLSSARSRAP